MTLLSRAAAIVRWALNRRRAEADLDDELQAFLAMATAEHVRQGVAPDEARRLAALELGGAEQVKERVRRGRHGGWIDEVARDGRHGLRQLRRSPGFSAMAIATLALGIGINAAMFSAVDAVLLRRLPFADADRLAMVWDDTGQDGEGKVFATPPTWQAWRRDNTVFTDIAASQPGDAVLSGVGEPEDLPARKVSGNFWQVLGVRAQIGRVFTETDDRRGARVVVISHGLWQRRFGGSPDIVGRTLTLNDLPHEVVGVMPRNFYFLPARDVDVWLPTSFSAAMLRNWGWRDVQCVARLKPGVSFAAANTAMGALGRRISAEQGLPSRSPAVTPVRDDLTGKTSTSLLVLLAGAATVLLMACLNLANVLVARGATRRREVAVRAALGASRARLVRQFLVENLIVAVLGALAGLAIAVPAMRFLETLIPPTMAAVQLSLDARVLAVSAALTLVVVLAFGLAPAIRGSRVALQDAMRDGGRGTAGVSSHRVQQSLIVAQTALAVALLTTGGLLLQTFRHLHQRDLGLRPAQVLTMVTPLFRYQDFEQRVAFVNSLLERITAISGVVSAGAISRIPLTVHDQATFYRLPGQSNDEARQQVALTRVVTRDYFTTVGASLREGRFFEVGDRRSTEPVVIVNESFARRHYAGTSALGQTFQFGNRGPNGYWYRVVGVVKEIRDRGVAQNLQPAVYRLHEQADQAGDQPSGIVVRTTGQPTAIAAAIRQAVWSVDPNQPIARVQTLEDIVERQLSVPSQNTLLSSAFAAVALLLASIGLYGMLAYAVTQRTSEIGVRMALGAQPRDIVLLVCGRGIVLTLTGLGIGLLLSVAAASTMQALFYGLAPGYVTAATGASLALLAVAAVACVVPARRATRIDPMTALQQD